jgi:hypothetical protein
MIEKPQRKTPEHDSDYDGAWKEALRHHLVVFLGGKIWNSGFA